MPFEPLQTDEKLDKPVKGPRDMDAAMLFGCSGFVIASILGYALSVWPFLTIWDVTDLSNLGLCCLFGLLPAAILGIVATRKFGLAGACGFVGGAMATGIFLFLRIQECFLAWAAKQGPRPDFPALFQYLLPLVWIVLTVILSLIALPRSEVTQ